MYTANGKKFESFFAAIDEAKKANCDVVETKSGSRRWTPAAKVSAKKIRAYEGQKNAYAAYKQMVK